MELEPAVAEDTTIVDKSPIIEVELMGGRVADIKESPVAVVLNVTNLEVDLETSLLFT